MARSAASPTGRPGRAWFALAPLATVAIVAVAGFWPGFTDPRLAVVRDVLSIAAAVAFLYGAWQSIETRTALARLEAIVGTVPPAARQRSEGPDGQPAARRDQDLAVIGKAILSEELQEKLIGHIRKEWLAYVAGSALLLALLVLSLLGHALA